MQLLLLTTTGTRTGQRRAAPLTYLPRRIPLIVITRR
jgi:hypothetical protein